MADLAEDGLALHLSIVLLPIDVDRRCVADTILYSLDPVFLENRVNVAVASSDCCVGHAPLDLLAVDLELPNDMVGAEVSDCAFFFQTTEPDVVQVVEPEVSIVLVVLVNFIEDALCSHVLSQHHCFVDKWVPRNHLFVWRGETVFTLLDAMQIHDFRWAESAFEGLYSGNEHCIVHKSVLVFI